MTRCFVGSALKHGLIVIGSKARRGFVGYELWNGNEWVLCQDIMKVNGTVESPDVSDLIRSDS